MSHDEAHYGKILKYVSGGLTDAEKLEAQATIRGCDACQEELVKIKEIRSSIHQLSDEDTLKLLRENEPLRQALERPLAADEMNPGEYRQALDDCDQVFHRALTTAGLAAKSPVSLRSLLIWKKLAFAFAALWVLAIPIGVYKIVDGQKELHRKDAYYEKLASEQAKKDQLILQEREQIEQLRRQIADLSKGDEKGGQKNEKLAELMQKAEALSKESQKQLQTITELSQTLEKYRRPGPDALFLAPLSATRQSDEVITLQVPKEALLVCLQARISREEDHVRYRLILKDPQKKAIAQIDRAKKEEDGTFNYTLARDLLKPGEYVLEIYGIDGSQMTMIWLSRFRILRAE